MATTRLMPLHIGKGQTAGVPSSMSTSDSRCFADRGAVKAKRQNPGAAFHDYFRYFTRLRLLILHGDITITAFSNERRESTFRKRL